MAILITSTRTARTSREQSRPWLRRGLTLAAIGSTFVLSLAVGATPAMAWAGPTAKTWAGPTAKTWAGPTALTWAGPTAVGAEAASTSTGDAALLMAAVQRLIESKTRLL
jgi:hypothetical protein